MTGSHKTQAVSEALGIVGKACINKVSIQLPVMFFDKSEYIGS